MKRNRNKKNKKIIVVVENILFQATRRRKKTSKESTFYYVPTFAVCIAKNDTLFVNKPLLCHVFTVVFWKKCAPKNSLCTSYYIITEVNFKFIQPHELGSILITQCDYNLLCLNIFPMSSAVCVLAALYIFFRHWRARQRKTSSGSLVTVPRGHGNEATTQSNNNNNNRRSNSGNRSSFRLQVHSNLDIANKSVRPILNNSL